MTLRIHEEATAEAERAARWYNRQKPGLGRQFANEYADALAEIEESPRRYPVFEILQRSGREFRHHLFRRFPYVVIYEMLDDDVVILAVAHAGRDPTFWRERLEVE